MVSGEKPAFPFDLGVGKKVEDWIRRQGYDLVSVRDLNPRMTDKEILERAAKAGRVVVTMDKDFGEMIFKSRVAHTGVLLLRMEEAKAEDKIGVLTKILADHGNKLTGRFCVYKHGRLRIRPVHER